MKERNMKNACKRLIAIMVAVTLSLTGLPWLSLLRLEAYANESEAGTVTEAEALLETAKKAKNEAQAEVDEAQEAFNSAESEYNAAVAERESRQGAKDSAYSSYVAAQEETQAALNEKNAAETAKEEAQTSLKEATANLEEKTRAEQNAQEELTQAESDVEDAEKRLAGEKTTAQETLDAAQEVFDNAGYEFINEKVNALGSSYYPIDEIIQKEKSSTYGPIEAWNGTDSLYIKDVVSDSNFMKIVKDSCSYDNLKKGIEIMRRTNALRTADRHGLNELGVNYQLIANAVVSNSITAYLRGHNLTSSSDYLYWKIDTPWNYRPRNENLSYSTAPMGSQYDPFDGLYYKERIVKLGKDAGGLTQSIIDRVAAEAAADGSSYVPGSLSELSSETVTGHYLAIIEPALTAQGAAYAYTPTDYLKYMGYWKYRARVAQEFNNTTKNIITLTQYENALENHFADKKTALENAKAEVERLKTKPGYLQQAESNKSEKQEALTNAQQEKTNAESDKAAAETALSAAETALSNKISAYNSAAAEEENKLNDNKNAEAEYNDAVRTENEKADKKNRRQGILETKTNALKEAEDAEIAAKAVYDSFFNLENAIIADIDDQAFTGGKIEPVVVVKNKGETDTLVKGTDYVVEFSNNINAGTATAIIRGAGSYKGSNSKTFIINPKTITEDMVGTIEQVVYDGGAKKPDVAVTDGKKRLAKEKDYIIEYSNNTEVGNATAEIKGTGNYSGSVYRNFVIISRELAELQDLIATLEEDLTGETDEDFIASITAALEEAREAVNETDTDYLSSVINSVRGKKEAATSALEKKKEAARKAEEEAKRIAEEEAARKKAEAEKSATAAARAKQSGEGGAVGKGASIEFAEKSILTSVSDEGPKGSKFAPLMLKSTKQGKTNIILTWAKVSGAKKYVIYGNACGKKNRMKKLVTVTGKTYNVKKIGKKLKKGTYHKFMIVALDSKNNVVSTSKVIHVATKGNKKNANPTKVTVRKPKTLKKGKTHKLAAKQVGKNVKKHRAIKYETSNAKIASVSSKGVIKAKKKGSCYIYAYAQNGICRKVKVTVK